MTKISSSTKFNEVAAELATLNGVHKISDIVNLILQISNFKSETLKGIPTSEQYGAYSPDRFEKIDNLFVDMTYQRKVRLRKLINKLLNAGEFNKEAAGHLDVAMRGDRAFVWDGLRRAIMAAITGINYIPVSKLVHAPKASEIDMQEKEAKMFKMRNADNETMKPEEIFKSKVVYRDPEALKLLNVLKNAKLDVEGLNPSGRALGGFKLLETTLNRKIQEEYVITSSEILQKIYPNESVMSGYLLCGLSKFLEINDEFDNAKSDEQILNDLKDFVNSKPRKKQTDFTSARLNSKPLESIAYFIVKNAVKLNGNTNKFVSLLNLDNDEIDTIEDLA
jgi:hypothetical protein